MPRFKRMLTFSNVTAMVALFFALGGSVYAAAGKIDGTQIKAKSIPGNRIKAKSLTGSQLKPGSIGAGQIKAGAIGAKQIKAASITASQIAKGTITGNQVKSGSLTGSQIDGATLTGVSAASLASITYVTQSVNLVKGQITGTGGTANCPTGQKVIGGGATVSNSADAIVDEGAPTAARTGWFASGFSSADNVTMSITAICAAVVSSTG